MTTTRDLLWGCAGVAMVSTLTTPPHRAARLPELCGPVGIALQVVGLGP